MAYKNINPNDGKTLKTFPELSDEQLEKRIATSTHTFEAWKKTSYAERALIVAKAVELMHANVDKFAKHATT
jgi:succinate-semialdehyde dehydrogenase/glutarate-semialdehyde dehydrogenase